MTKNSLNHKSNTSRISVILAALWRIGVTKQILIDQIKVYEFQPSGKVRGGRHSGSARKASDVRRNLLALLNNEISKTRDEAYLFTLIQEKYPSVSIETGEVNAATHLISPLYRYIEAIKESSSINSNQNELNTFFANEWLVYRKAIRYSKDQLCYVQFPRSNSENEASDALCFTNVDGSKLKLFKYDMKNRGSDFDYVTTTFKGEVLICSTHIHLRGFGFKKNANTTVTGNRLNNTIRSSPIIMNLVIPIHGLHFESEQWMNGLLMLPHNQPLSNGGYANAYSVREVVLIRKSPSGELTKEQKEVLKKLAEDDSVNYAELPTILNKAANGLELLEAEKRIIKSFLGNHKNHKLDDKNDYYIGLNTRNEEKYDNEEE